MTFQQLLKPIILLVLTLISTKVLTQEIDWYSIDAGGGISNGNNIQLIGVIGQSDTIRMSGGNISLSGGYLALPPDPDSVFKDGYE